MFYSFYYWQPSLVATPNSSNTNEFSFDLTGLPSLTGANAKWKVMLSHGDGTYFFGTLAELSAHRHTYSNGNHTAFAEVVAAYDDDKKPPKRAISVPVNISGLTNPSQPDDLQTMNGRKILLRKTTRAVPGDIITYMITYEHDATCNGGNLGGTIKFQFDDVLFNYVSTDRFNSEDANYNSAGLVTISFDNTNKELVSGEQRSVFITLQTKTTAQVGTLLGSKPNVEVEFKYKPTSSEYTTCTHTSSIHRDTIHDQSISDSHDPNFKTVVQNGLCNGDYVTWRVDFQNEGTAPETLIVVSDWIDTLFEYESVTVLQGQCTFQVSAERYNPANREWRFVMSGPNVALRGLGESGVREDETKGHVVFRVKKRAHPKCNAAANSARIIFGCNPPVFTDVALADFPCTTDSLPQPLPCPTCTTFVFDSLPVVAADTGVALITPAQLASFFANLQLPNSWTYKWYPALHLSNPLVAMPTLTRAVNRKYTLVASHNSDCVKVVVHVLVKPPTPLGLTFKKWCTGTTSGDKWNVTATATPTSRSNTDLLWKPCGSNVGSQSIGPVSGGNTAYFGVWDTLTDQVAEGWVWLPDTCPSPNFPWGWVLVILGGIVLVVAAARFFLGRRR